VEKYIQHPMSRHAQTILYILTELMSVDKISHPKINSGSPLVLIQPLATPIISPDCSLDLHGKPSHRLGDKDESGCSLFVSEAALIRDCILSLRGDDGLHVQFDPQTQQFRLKGEVYIVICCSVSFLLLHFPFSRRSPCRTVN
jgi:hypothetical protein